MSIWKHELRDSNDFIQKLKRGLAELSFHSRGGLAELILPAEWDSFQRDADHRYQEFPWELKV